MFVNFLSIRKSGNPHTTLTNSTDMFDMHCCAHHCLKTLFGKKEKCPTFLTNPAVHSAPRNWCRYVCTACTRASSLAGDSCDALQPPAEITPKRNLDLLYMQPLQTGGSHTHTYIYVCIYIYICVYACVYIYIYVYMGGCVTVGTHKGKRNLKMTRIIRCSILV